MNTRARCTGCGKSGNTRGNRDMYKCMPCRHVINPPKPKSTLERKSRVYDNEPVELTGGRWVQDGWIQRWKEAG